MERPELERLGDELRLSLWESFVIRAANLLFAFVGRGLDLAILLVRPGLLSAYFAVWWAELLSSPYRWPRSFEAVRLVKESGQSLRELMYGEAPVFSAVWLLWRAGVRRGSRVLDLGAGRGRVLIAARWLRAEAVGVELRPEHVSPVAHVLRRIGAELRLGDVLKDELGLPTHVFLNWCAWSEQTRSRLSLRLARLPPGSRLVCVVRPVSGDSFRLVRKTCALLTWGPERVTIHERVG